MKSNNSTNHSPTILGMVTVNEKGQVVIPSEARTLINLNTGDRLIVMVHPSKEGVVLIKPDGLEAYAKQMLSQLNFAKERDNK